ncbi:MAG TPA: NUDIX domain-containing protein [Rhodanobacteraceae bacterium]
MQGNVPVRCAMVSLVVLRGRGDACEVLLLRRASHYMHGAWTYVAGHVEAGETGWQAALRELDEETALTPDALYSSGHVESFYNAADNVVELVPAFVAMVDAAAQVRLNVEHDAYRWLAFDDALPILPFASQRTLFAHVRRQFIERDPPSELRLETGRRETPGTGC